MSTLKATNIKNESSASNNIVLDSNGNVSLTGVAIGAASPTAGIALDVTGSIATDAASYFYNSTRDGLGIWYNPGGAGVNQLTARLGGTDRLTIDSSGRLLVGTSSAVSAGAPGNAYLQIKGRAGGTVGRLTLASTSTAPSTNSVVSEMYFTDADGGIYGQIECVADGTAGTNDYPGRLVFSTTADGASSPTERMRLDSSGRLAIGVTGPGSYFSDARNLVVGNTAGDAGVSIVSNISNKGTIAFADGTTGDQAYRGYIQYNHNGDALAFATSGTEAFRVDSSRRLLVGTSSSLGGRIGVLYTSSVEAGITIQSTVNSFNTAIQFLNTSGNQTGYITGGETTVSYVTGSDYRLKENVLPVTDGINRLQQLKPSRFNFIADPAKTVDGFLAHEVQSVVPEAIHGVKDEVDADGNPIYQGIDQSKLVPLLTAALQEAIGEIESLKARVAALESA